MAGRRKGEKKLYIEKPDFAVLFAEAGRRIVLRSGTLEAYRRSSGLVFHTKQTPLAHETLAVEIGRCRYGFAPLGTMSDAYEHAGRWAMKSYLGNWWETRVTDTPPARMGPGDEFYSKRTVSRIVEQYGEFVPDLRG